MLASQLLLFCCWGSVVFVASQVACHDPVAKVDSTHPKFLIFASGGGSGIGNVLEYFPSVFTFAACSGRFIVIDDDSPVGDFCRIVTCGFPLVSEMAQMYPDILSADNVAKAHHIKGVAPFANSVIGKVPLKAPLIRVSAYMHLSDWYLWQDNATIQCVADITNCTQKDKVDNFLCSDHFAFQALVKGPFKSTILEKEEHNVIGAPSLFVHSLLSVPHLYAPRVDIAVHLRNQFAHFENQDSIDATAYRTEVADWLNSSTGSTVFKWLEDKILLEMKDIGDNAGDPVIIYVAGDNEEVKDAFISTLESTFSIASTVSSHEGYRPLADNATLSPLQNSHNVHVMHLNSDKIVHLKFRAEKQIKSVENRQGLLDMVFDWYAMSLSKKAISYRRDGSTIRSTFSESAHLLSKAESHTLEVKHGKYRWVKRANMKSP